MTQPVDIDFLLRKSKTLVAKGKLDRAEALLKEAAEADEGPTSLNNLAALYYLKRDYQKCLDTLKPCLEPHVTSPYARALAAQCLVGLGRTGEASRRLREAVTQFNWGVPNIRRLFPGSDPRTFYEYSTLILQAAGVCGDYSMVVELYQKWRQCLQGEQPHLLAGMAYFNLGRYDQAAKAWKRCVKDYATITKLYSATAQLMDSGIVPPFELDFSVPIPMSPVSAETLGPDVGERSTPLLAALIGMLFTSKQIGEREQEALRSIVSGTGEWGISLAHSVLQADQVSRPMKIGVALGLIDAGEVCEGDSIPVVVDGELVTLTLTSVPDDVRGLIDDGVKRADELRMRGQFREGIEVLLSIKPKVKESYPPYLFTLSLLYLGAGMNQEASDAARRLLSVAPDDVRGMLVAANAAILLEDYRRAEALLDGVPSEGLPREAEEAYLGMKKFLANRKSFDMVDDAVFEIGVSYTEEEIGKPLPEKPTLANCLRRIPVQWLDGICQVYGVPLKGRRREREVKVRQEILTVLGSRARLSSLLESDTRDLLGYLLANDGISRLGQIARKYGSLLDDSFWWDEDPPASILGKLCRLGLAFVGTRLRNGRNYKVAVIPGDALELLTGLDIV